MYSPSTCWWVLHGSCMLESCCCQRTSIGEPPTCLGYLPKGAKISVWRYLALSRTVREGNPDVGLGFSLLHSCDEEWHAGSFIQV